MIPAVLLCAAAACRGGPPPSGGDAPPEPSPAGGASAQAPAPGAPVSLQTDLPAYTLRRDARYAVYEAWARVTFTNGGARPVYLGTCREARGPHYAVVTEGGEAPPAALTEACLRADGAPRIAVAPGETRTDSVRLVVSAAQRPPEGTYRLEAAIHARSEGGEGRLPRAESRSNVFRVRYQD